MPHVVNQFVTCTRIQKFAPCYVEPRTPRYLQGHIRGAHVRAQGILAVRTWICSEMYVYVVVCVFNVPPSSHSIDDQIFVNQTNGIIPGIIIPGMIAGMILFPPHVFECLKSFIGSSGSPYHAKSRSQVRAEGQEVYAKGSQDPQEA